MKIISNNKNRISITIAIAAFNEEESIEKTLLSVFRSINNMDQNTEVIVVASGCTDNTAKKARKVLQNFTNYKVIEEKQRKGKSSALNKIVGMAKGEVIIFCDADVIVNSNSFKYLCHAFEEEESLGLAYAKVEVINGHSKFWSKIGRLSAQALDAYRSQKNNRGKWMVNGYLYAIRKLEWPCIPEGVVADDVYIGLNFTHRNSKILYLPNSVVKVRYPQTFHDYFSQKIRNRSARRQLKHSYKNVKLPTKWIGLDFLCANGLSALKYVPIIIWDSLMVCFAEYIAVFQYKQTPLWKKISSSKLSSTDDYKEV